MSKDASLHVLLAMFCITTLLGMDDFDAALVFAAKKKKKSKGVVDGTSTPGDGTLEGVASLSLGGSEASVPQPPQPYVPSPTEDGGDQEETYEEMLSRVYTLLNEHNPELIGRSVFFPFPLAIVYYLRGKNFVA